MSSNSSVVPLRQQDLEDVLKLVTARKAELISATEPGPASVEAWHTARTRSRLEGAALRGAAVSAARRSAAKDAGIERIREHWGKPLSEWSIMQLRQMATEPGAVLIAYNTIRDRLKGREEAQRLYRLKLKRQQGPKGKTDE